MKLTNVTSPLARSVSSLKKSIMGLARTTLLPTIVSLVLILTAPALYASELRDNQAVLTQYMQTFQMDGWHITLVMANSKIIEALGGAGAVGASQMNMNTKYGVVYVLRRSEYTPEFFKVHQMNEQDEEWVIIDQRNTVVHELIHMVWRYCGQEEQCVSMLAEAVIPHEDTH